MTTTSTSRDHSTTSGVTLQGQNYTELAILPRRDWPEFIEIHSADDIPPNATVMGGGSYDDFSNSEISRIQSLRISNSQDFASRIMTLAENCAFRRCCNLEGCQRFVNAMIMLMKQELPTRAVDMYYRSDNDGNAAIRLTETITELSKRKSYILFKHKSLPLLLLMHRSTNNVLHAVLPLEFLYFAAIGVVARHPEFQDQTFTVDKIAQLNMIMHEKFYFPGDCLFELLLQQENSNVPTVPTNLVGFPSGTYRPNHHSTSIIRQVAHLPGITNGVYNENAAALREQLRQTQMDNAFLKGKSEATKEANEANQRSTQDAAVSAAVAVAQVFLKAAPQAPPEQQEPRRSQKSGEQQREEPPVQQAPPVQEPPAQQAASPKSPQVTKLIRRLDGKLDRIEGLLTTPGTTPRTIPGTTPVRQHGNGGGRDFEGFSPIRPRMPTIPSSPIREEVGYLARAMETLLKCLEDGTTETLEQDSELEELQERYHSGKMTFPLAFVIPSEYLGESLPGVIVRALTDGLSGAELHGGAVAVVESKPGSYEHPITVLFQHNSRDPKRIPPTVVPEDASEEEKAKNDDDVRTWKQNVSRVSKHKNRIPAYAQTVQQSLEIRFGEDISNDSDDSDNAIIWVASNDAKSSTPVFHELAKAVQSLNNHSNPKNRIHYFGIEGGVSDSKDEFPLKTDTIRLLGTIPHLTTLCFQKFAIFPTAQEALLSSHTSCLQLTNVTLVGDGKALLVPGEAARHADNKPYQLIIEDDWPGEFGNTVSMLENIKLSVEAGRLSGIVLRRLNLWSDKEFDALKKLYETAPPNKESGICEVEGVQHKGRKPLEWLPSAVSIALTESETAADDAARKEKTARDEADNRIAEANKKRVAEVRAKVSSSTAGWTSQQLAEMKKNGGGNMDSLAAVNESAGGSDGSVPPSDVAGGFGSASSDDYPPPLAEERTNYLRRFLADEEFKVLASHMNKFVEADNDGDARGLRKMKKGSKVKVGQLGELATVVKTTEQKIVVVKDGEEYHRERPRYFPPSSVSLYEKASEGVA